MVSRQPDPASSMQALGDRLVKLYTKADLNKPLMHSERAELAEDTIQVWWEIYDCYIFWAQCELLGQDIMQQHFDLLTMLRDKHLLTMESEHQLAEALGYYFSTSDKSAASKALRSALGEDQLELVRLLAKAGLSEPGSFMRLLLSSSTKSNAYLRAELHRLASAMPATKTLTERDIDHAFPTEITNWKLEAARQVRLLVGGGLKKIAALSEVAAAIRHSIDDLQRWERDLVKFSDFENDLFCAELVGEFGDQLRASHFTNIRNYKFYGSFEGVLNLERATTLSRHLRQVRVTDINQALRGVH
ncbi:hypothetical protein [Devosia beringensis]|uniref:hypothetical protein n=1 Tax=Devosia beringensis TaxID=2657486 RepID=UPI00186B647D|nr:hypothetical protein [Devosia beringensis]